MPRPTQVPHHGDCIISPTGLSPSSVRLSGRFRYDPVFFQLHGSSPCGPTTPLMRFGLLRFRSPLLAESLLISFPRLLRWFTSSRVAPPHYFIHACGAGIAPCGLPHSAVRGSPNMCSYPRLFAAYRGLLRLQAPRHPPWTYFRLTILPLPPLHSRTRMHSSTAADPRLRGGLLHSFNFYC